MKKYLLIICAMAMIASLIGCGSSGSSGSSSNHSSVATDGKQSDVISIKDYYLSTDSKNEPLLIVNYEFRNYTEETKTFSSLFKDKAFQNGVACKGIVLIGNKEFDANAETTEVLPGYSFTVNQAYIITDNSDVLITVTGNKNKKTYIEETISLDELKAKSANNTITNLEEKTETVKEDVTEATKITEIADEAKLSTEENNVINNSGILPETTDEYVDYIGKSFEIENISQMFAGMIGAEEGTSFKYNDIKFEIYRFKGYEQILKEAAKGSVILQIEGLGEYETLSSVNGCFMMIYDTPDDKIIEAFESLK
ncbi:MAG TPA: DUF5067 domain-containing protein [Ruminococcus sp.]|nr:DUF5067 domain-containing protein [Ruminococcus sp.]